MSIETLDDGTRDKLMKVSVAPLAPKPVNMVGQAYTLRTIPAREDLSTVEVFQNPDHPQRLGVERCPPGFAMVIDSRKDPRAVSAGSMSPCSPASWWSATARALW